jgi:hypothetical protein
VRVNAKPTQLKKRITTSLIAVHTRCECPPALDARNRSGK